MAKKKRKGCYKKGTKPKANKSAAKPAVQSPPAKTADASQSRIVYEETPPKQSAKKSITDIIHVSDKKLIITAAVFALAIAGLIISQIVMFSQAKKYTEMYENQLSVNQQLEELIEALGTDVSTAGDELPIVAGENSSALNNDPNRGYFEDIPSAVREQLQGSSMGSDSPVTYEELAYLSVPYYDFNGEIKTGHLITARDLADEVLDIFAELVAEQYPIENMEIIEQFSDRQNNLLNTDEAAARGSNDTFGFYYKKGSGRFSANSYGRAVEINTKINPRVEANGTTIPKNAVKYTDRSIALDGAEKWAFITEDSDIVNLFTSKGWKWGGFDGGTDYGHFEKENAVNE